ncbi:MAG: T9SS type A sorting domain-containing protein [Bacteroidales bacterium]|nr:T9SS type A sorting domain-containing protein [Bacteroidales bacterium]
MTKFYLTLTTYCLLVLPALGQTSLTPEKWYDVATWLPDYPNVGAFDFSDTLFYLNDGDTIHMFGVNSGVEQKKFGEPEDYTATHYVSFLTVSPDGETIWTGYTSSDNLDDRIYSIDAESGEWELEAIFPANMDLEFWNDSILVSGLNSSSWDAPAAIFVLDTSGANEHRRIIEPGGYSAGLAVDQQGNLYYGTSYPMDPNGLYRWDSSSLQLVIENPDSPALQVSHGEKLSDLPSGAYDCEVDEGGNVLFNMNLAGGTQAVGMWNGTIGDGNNIDTLATASGEWDWLGTLKAKGDVSLAGPDNMLVTYSFGQPLAIVTRLFTVDVERDYALEVNTYPNPSTGILTIQSGSSELMDVKLYTLQGALIYVKADFQSGSAIDISNQPAGSYIIRINSSRGLTSKMIQKL